ncbi:MAG: acyl-CoA thioesterase [Chloroflexota bacterium]
MKDAIARLGINLPEDVPAWLDGFHFWLDFKVRLYETDANGHMSELTYFAYQELGSTEYCGHLGFTSHLASQSDESLFMGEQFCRFLSEVRFGESVRLGVRCVRVGGASLGLEYVLIHADRRLAAVGANTLVLVELATRHSRPLPPELRQAIETFEA